MSAPDKCLNCGHEDPHETQLNVDRTLASAFGCDVEVDDDCGYCPCTLADRDLAAARADLEALKSLREQGPHLNSLVAEENVRLKDEVIAARADLEEALLLLKCVKECYLVGTGVLTMQVEDLLRKHGRIE